MNPKIIKQTFSNSEYNSLKQYLLNKDIKSLNYDETFSRYGLNDNVINEYAEKLVPLARQIFNSDTLVHSYSLFSHYEGNSSLYKHKDDNACTYTLDMCVYQNAPWGLWVDDQEYILNENESLAYYGNDQYHWRDPIPDTQNQHVAMIFFHFVEPGHWWLTKGPGYIEVIRGKMTEEEWQKKIDLL